MSTHISSFETRRVVPEDVAALIDLCMEHAAFERADGPVTATPEQLSNALFGPKPCLFAWVAECNDSVGGQVTERGGGIVAYATATIDYATWSGENYVHLDCLFVREAWRDVGIGADLLNDVIAFTIQRGHTQIQWQTPSWNHDASRFYRRIGAKGVEKKRFVLNISP